MWGVYTCDFQVNILPWNIYPTQSVPNIWTELEHFAMQRQLPQTSRPETFRLYQFSRWEKPVEIGWSGRKISPHLAPLESRLLRPLWTTSRAVLPLVENWVKETQPKLAKVHSTSWKPGAEVYVQRDSWTGAWKVAQWKNCSSPKTGDLCTVYMHIYST